MITYIALTDKRLDKRSPKGGFGFLSGRSTGWFRRHLAAHPGQSGRDQRRFCRGARRVSSTWGIEFVTRLFNFLRGFWELLTPVSGPAWFVLVTLLLIFAAFTLRWKANRARSQNPDDEATGVVHSAG